MGIFGRIFLKKTFFSNLRKQEEFDPQSQDLT